MTHKWSRENENNRQQILQYNITGSFINSFVFCFIFFFGVNGENSRKPDFLEIICSSDEKFFLN